MDKNDVFKLLEENKNEKGIKNWYSKDRHGLDSFGIGLTIHRKLAKKIGRNAELAGELWETNNYDAKVISLLIDNPKTMTREQVEKQVDQLHGGYLVHVFSSCNSTLGKTSFVVELIEDWIAKGNPIRKQCAYGFLYDLSRSKKKSTPGDDFFIKYLNIIEKNYKEADKNLLLSMGLAIQGIGTRNKDLNGYALKLAREIGPIDFNEEGQKCDPYDVVKHLTSPYVVGKFN